MTTIIGFNYNDKHYICADKRITLGEQYQDDAEKIYRGEDWIFASSRSIRLDQEIFSNLRKTGATLSMFIEELEKAIKKLKDLYPDFQSNDFIFANPVGIWNVIPNASFIPINDFYAVGSGREFATGMYMALRLTIDEDSNIAQILMDIITMTSRLNPYTSRESDCYSVDKKGEIIKYVD